MRRLGAGAAAVIALTLTMVVVAPATKAALRQASIGNYWFEDDETKRRDRIEAQQGDQIRFTVRETTYPPHSVEVDELGISSPELLLFETYTTPPLNKPGTYRLYCRGHLDRGHVTTLVVRPAPTATAPTRNPPERRGPSATATSTSSTTSPEDAPLTDPFQSPSSTVPPEAGSTESTLAPVGVGQATDRRRPPVDPDSLAGLIGRPPATPGPWTRAVRLGAAAAALLLGVTVAAVAYGWRRERESA